MTTVVGVTAQEIGEAPRRRHFSLPRSLDTHISEVALETSHLDKSELKAAAFRNICLRVRVRVREAKRGGGTS